MYSCPTVLFKYQEMVCLNEKWKREEYFNCSIITNIISKQSHGSTVSKWNVDTLPPAQGWGWNTWNIKVVYLCLLEYDNRGL